MNDEKIDRPKCEESKTISIKLSRRELDIIYFSVIQFAHAARHQAKWYAEKTNMYSDAKKVSKFLDDAKEGEELLARLDKLKKDNTN